MGVNTVGVPKIDIYAQFLRTMGEPLFGYAEILWVVRGILLVALVLHIVSVIHLVRQNKAARPQAYVKHRRVESSLAARWMMVTGLLLFAFIVMHILHLTTGTIDFGRFVDGKVYANLYYSFQHWYVALIYVVAMALLMLHLRHGAWSLFQTLGFDNPDRNRGLRYFATGAALLLFIGFSAVPTAIYVGALPSPTHVTLNMGEGS